MNVAAAILPALLLAAFPAPAQSIFKCTTPAGAVTYQATPCPAQGRERRIDTDGGREADPVARQMLEREARRGDPLARGFADEARERDRRERQERLDREERLRRERAANPPKADGPGDWMPPWGWPGPPGLARPKAGS